VDVGDRLGRSAVGIEVSAKYTSKAAMMTDKPMKMNRWGSLRRTVVIADQYHQLSAHLLDQLRTVSE
jgi:hypothetical protein